ncbi:hypothetical protein [Lacisediminihabitans changchengi]|uniref:Uncharacterized protein n=1 Tax=Lacisediminihabitans changchengi TaxID=2787634 RepID=A0A934W5E2_9MICO|nr:hypothetical protein [Lacisediminihabitans changchengi]MBK4348405.1 hypothetical protein [Lacisediminihabitans changchengi]
MANNERRAREQARQRAEYLLRTRPAEEQKMPPGLPFLIVGAAGLAAGVALLWWMVGYAFNGGVIDDLFPTVTPRFPRAAAPAVIFMLSGIVVFLGEMFRRARWSFREVQLTTAGMTTIRVRRLPLGIVLAWAAVPLVAWAGAVVVPIVLAPGSSPSDDLWLLAMVYGFIAAGVFGVFFASVVRRLAFARYRPRPVGAGEQRFWRIVSVQWHAGLWLGFLGGGAAGVIPLAAVHGIASAPVALAAVPWLAAIAGALVILSAILSAGAPRSGYDDGVAESVI